MPPRSVYIHVPFCAKRCGYCNFTVVANRLDLAERYLEAIDLELGALDSPRDVETIYIGGGTPTQLGADELRRLLRLVRHWFSIHARGEFTVEANPDDLTDEKAELLASAGVNRISLGVQSFQGRKLRALDREHTVEASYKAIALARRFATFSIDLIFAGPGETLEEWNRDLGAAIAAAPNHISTYGLTYEKGTTFWSRRNRGVLSSIDESVEAQMYVAGIDALAKAGYEHYEVSNFAAAGHQSRHNHAYWNGDEYLAFGPGAARYVDGKRSANHRSTSTYLRRVLAGESPVAESEVLSPEDRAREALVFGLRRLAGIQLDRFQERFTYGAEELMGDAYRRFQDEGWLLQESNCLRLTRAGLLISDSLWPEIIRR